MTHLLSPYIWTKLGEGLYRITLLVSWAHLGNLCAAIREEEWHDIVEQAGTATLQA